jgi:hypothetical protein
MKILSLVVLLTSLTVSSANAASARWRDIDVDDEVTLTQSLVLGATRGGEIRVRAGELYSLESIRPLEGISVVEYTFTPKRCNIPSLQSVLTLVLPKENRSDSKAEVGVYFLTECRLDVLVESQDLRSFSFFFRKSE